ncbi:MFS transporter [Glutamicibacter sp. ZJUTW]|uniref:MFS transporter n=2 Tax=unclassified Glutamicibacter TaxID=2627139 RepID=UPI0011F1C4C4|nr:MFS transporter [Glutamicibacter sp. ZJUTW]QEP08437.1 MFS transporter [Glutamicibacter sp. ZJUTW]
MLGIVLAVINFWLFAQTLLNVIPGIRGQLGVEETLADLAVSINSLFSGIFIVVAGGLVDRLGRAKILYLGIWLSIAGSLLIALTPENLGGLTSAMLLGGRVVQGLSAACIIPATMALVKTYYEGKGRQRALSYWSIGSWGGSGFCALFGGLMATSFLGWCSIFWTSIVLSVLALFLLKGTPESKAEQDPAAERRVDFTGLIFFIVMLVSINVYISQGPNIGWLSLGGIALVAIFVVTGLLFLQIEVRSRNPFVNLKLFSNGTFTGATLSNFLLNGAAGTLIVSLGLVQVAAGMSSLQSGLLTLGYLVAILATIRVGEKLLQRFGPKKPMLWGSMITGVGILMCSMTFLYIDQYILLSVIGFTLFGIGLGFYATPSTDAALSNVPDSEVGSASGIYKMASSLGNAIGVAISAALYVAGQAMDPALIQSWGLFIGRQDNVALRFGGAIGLLFNVLMVVIAIASIIVTVPSEKQKDSEKTKHDEVAPPPIGN